MLVSLLKLLLIVVPFLVSRSGTWYVLCHMIGEMVGVEWSTHGAGKASYRYMVRAVLQLLHSLQSTGRESAERDLWDVMR